MCCLLSHYSPKTCLVWLNLPGAQGSPSIALRVMEAPKAIHVKVTQHREDSSLSEDQNLAKICLFLTSKSFFLEFFIILVY